MHGTYCYSVIFNWYKLKSNFGMLGICASVLSYSNWSVSWPKCNMNSSAQLLCHSIINVYCYGSTLYNM